MVAKQFDTNALTALEDLPATDGADKDAPTPVRAHIKHSTTKEKGLSFWRVVHHTHRVAIFGCAIFYIFTCLQATVRSVDLLYGIALSPAPKPASPAKLMTEAIGKTTLRDSPLVQKMLNGDTSPRAGTVFLNASGHSFETCPMKASMLRIYTDAFMRATFANITQSTSYNHTFLAPSAIELVAPVVDCSNRVIVLGYDTVVTFYYLVRNRANHDDVSLMRVMMGNQDYRIPGQTGEGPAAVASIVFLSDLRGEKVEHFFVVSLGYPFERFNFRAATLLGRTEFGLWSLRVIPATGRKEIARTIETATRSGFFIKAETEQSNVNTHVWVLPTAPIAALTTTQWYNKPGLRDSWAWVHFLQLLLALVMISNLVILLMIVIQKLRRGKLWIGDAFVSVYNTLLLRGAFVLVSWYMNEFWAVFEFCLSDAATFSVIESTTIFSDIIEADLRSIFISLCGLLGLAFKTRVDPLVGFISFEVGYQNRLKILRWFPSIPPQAAAQALRQYSEGSATKNPFQKSVSPMLFWTTARLSHRSVSFIFMMFTPVLLALFAVVAFIAVRRAYLHFYPDPIRVLHSRATATSGDEAALRELQRRLTFFELATGAELNNRFGFLTEYDNALFIKGVKHASADGIYSNGFVIANGKFLLQNEDYWPLVLMKLLRLRYRNIFVYELEGSTVKQTARLVYPQTLAWADLVSLNITNLS